MQKTFYVFWECQLKKRKNAFLKSEKNVKIHIVEHWSQLGTWTLPGEQTDSRQVLDAGDIARSVPRLASSVQAPVRTVVSHLQQDVGKSRNVTATL